METQTAFKWADTIISFVLIGIMNLGLWYFVRFNKETDKYFGQIIIQHLTVSAIYTLVWLLLDYLILFFIFSGQDDFFKLLQNTFVTKLFVGFVIYLLVIFFYNFVIISRKNKENLQQRQELALLLQNEELNSLKSQINPHFLFNSLNSISYLVFNNADKAHDAIVKLSDYFRYTLTLSKTQFTKLKDEIENIKRYLEIEEIRFPDKLKLNVQLTNECNDLLVPVLLLQPLVENAIKHGVYQNSLPTQINIIVTNNSDVCNIEISNNYDNSAQKKVGTSTGIENTKKRLSLIYKRFDLLQIQKTDDFFKVILTIPKNVNQ